MKPILLILSFSLACPVNTFAQKKKKGRTEYQLKMDTLLAKLEGVKFVRILETQDYIDVVKNQAGNAVSSPDTRILSGFVNWVNDYLKLGVAFTKEQTEASIKNVSSFCDYVNAQIIVHPLKQSFFSSYPVEIVFTFCDNSQYIFDMKVAAVAHNSLESETRSMLRGYLTDKNTYDRNKRLNYHLQSRWIYG